jgi:hypothetical protein
MPMSKQAKREYNRCYHQKHRARLNARTREWRRLNADKISAISHETKMRYERKRSNRPEPTRPEPSSCDICAGKPVHGRRHLDEDHCHRTKQFRGWLCGECNRGIGMFKDDINLLARAIVYLHGVFV